jgi:general secretion pathway protein B
MSVILDALRKLDREKSSRQSGTADISIAILKPDLPRPVKRVPLYAAIALLTALAAAAITYSVMVQGGRLSKSPPPPATSPSVASQGAASVTLPSEPVGGARDEIIPAPPKTQAPVKTKKPAASLAEGRRDEAKMKQNVPVKEADVAPERSKIPPEPVPREPATTFPSLSISAIVWYEEPSKRFAMINGLIVREGAAVEGMKVEMIYPDRVRFLHRNQHFEIPIK